MANKYWWREENSAQKGSAQSQQNAGSKYWWRASDAKDAATDITNRVNTWLQNHNNYLSNYQTRFSNRKGNYEDTYVSDSADYLETIKKQKADFAVEADSILSYMDKYKDYLDADWMKSVRKTLAGAIDNQNRIANIATQDNAHWDSFGTEEMIKDYGSAEGAYKAHQFVGSNVGKTTAELDEILAGMEDSKAKELLTSYRSAVNLDEMGKYDLEAGAKEIEELERAADVMATVSNEYFALNNTSHHFTEAEKTRITSQYNALVGRYGSPEELHDKLNTKKQYLEKAKQIQDVNKMSVVTGNADFAKNSQYVSNMHFDGFGTPYFTDELYAYINNPTVTYKNKYGTEVTETARQKIDYEFVDSDPEATTRLQDSYYAQNAIGCMNKDEIKIFNYYYATEGKEKAREYLNLLIPTLKERQRAEAFNTAYEIGNEHPFLGSAISVVTSMASAPEYIEDVVRYGTEKLMGKDAKLDRNEMAMTTNAIRGAVSEKVDWEIGNWDAFDFLYNTTMSGIDSLASTAFGGAGGVVLGLSAAAQGTNDALERGMNDGQAFWNGLFSGVFEGLFESVSIGNFNRLKEIAPNGVKDIIKNLGKSMLVNASEETLTEIANIAYDTLVNGEFANYTMEELRNGAWKQALGQVVEAGVSGALMGMGMSTVGSAIGNAKANKKAKAEYGGKTDTLINQGLQNDADSKSYQLATKYQQKVQGKDGKNGKALTGQQIRNLLAANQDAITDKDMQKIQQAAEKRLAELGQTENVAELAEIATKWATGQEITRAEKKLLTHSQYGSRVANELLPDNIDSGGYSTEWAEDIGTQKVNAKQYNKKQISQLLKKMASMEDSAAYKSLEDRVGKETTFKVSEDGQATDSKTGKGIDLSKVEVAEFVKDKDGEIVDMVLNVGGKQVKASKVDYADGDQSYLFEAVSKIENITPGDATAFVRGYDPSSGLSVGEYLNGIDEAYTYGYHNYSEADMQAGNFAPKLSSEKAKGAYELGKITKSKSDTSKSEAIKQMRTAVEAEIEKAKAEGKEAPKAKNLTVTYDRGNGDVVSIDKAGIRDAKRSGAVEVAKILHKLGLGTKVGFFSSYLSKTLKDEEGNAVRVFLDENGVEKAAPSGVYRKGDGTIRVDLNAYNGRGLTLNALSHELTHFIQQWSAAKYKALADFLIKTYEKTDMTMHERVLREQARLEGIRGEKVSYDEAFDEVVANAMSKMLDDGKLVERLTELKAQDEKLARKLWQGFKKILARFIGIYENAGPLFQDTADLMAMKETFEQLQNMFAEAMVEASENYQASLTVAESQTLAESSKEAGTQQSSQKTDADAAPEINAKDVVDSGNGVLAVNISSKKSGLNRYKKSKWASVISKQIRATLQGHAIYAADGDIIRITDRAPGEVSYGTDSNKLFAEAKKTGDYSAFNKKMITADHAMTIIALSTYDSWSANTEDPNDMFKKDGLNHRKVNLVIDGEPYTAVVLTCLNIDPNQSKDYGEKFYDIVSIEKQAKHSAMNGTFVTKATPHKIKLADGSPDMLTIAQKERIVNRKNSTYSTGDAGTKTAMAEAFARAKELKSTQETDYSNRSLLANAFEGLSQSSVEHKMIQEYKDQIKVLNLLEEQLSDLNAEIREIRFTKGKYDAKKLKALEEKAERIAKDINKQDKTLLRMEASEPLRKVIEFERKKAAQKTKEHIAEIQQNKKLKAEQTELRHKIRKTVRDLDKILKKGNKQRNVKEDMQGFVSKALELADYLFTDHISNDELIRRGITVRMTPQEAALVKETEDIISQLYDNADNLTDEEFTELDAKRKDNEAKLRDLLTAQRNERLSTPVYNLFDDLVTEYASLENASQEAVRASYSEELENSLRAFISDDDRVKILKNMRVADMTTEELNWLDRAYTMVLHSVRTANKLFVDGKTQSTDQMASRIVADFSKRKAPDGKAATVIRNLSNKLGWNYEKLYYALDRIGSEAFTELVMNLANSENTVMQDVMEAVAFRDKVVKNYGFNNWKYNKEIDRDFLDATGKKFRLTLGQLMSLYAYSRRDGAWDHIEYGGFSFKDTPITENNSAASYKLSKEQCEAITNTLTKEQKAYVEDMQKFLSETMGAKGNEVSMLLYGIKMFGEKNYFPIHIDGRFVAKANESQAKAAAGFSTMSNAGFTHAQNPNAKAPFLLESFNEVWADHVNEMSRYHGAVPALEDFRRVMNRTSYMVSTEDSTSMYAALENSFGKEAAEYFQDLYREANSGAITDKMQKVSKKFLSLFRKNSVAYSLSVVIQQPSAIKRAYAMIDPKYFGFKGVGALTSGVAKAVSSRWNPAYAKAYNEMLKYAPGVTMAKEIGGFDTHTGSSIREYLLDTEKSFKQSMKTENLKGKGKAVLDLVDDNAIANLPTVADKIAWIEIWNACKRETVAKHKDLATNSEEFMQIVGDRFTEVIRATQVYDSIFAKSPMLKSKYIGVQYLVSFMNEPNTTANMVEKAVRDAAKGDWKGGARTALFVAYSILWNNALKAIVYAMRDDDEDETYIEKYLSAVAGGLFNDVLPMNYIPFVRDVWSVLQGYDVERADMAIVSDAVNALVAVVKNAFTETEEMTEEDLIEFDKKVTDANWKLVGSLTTFFGIPVKNVYREIDGIFSQIRIASANAGMTTVNSLLDKVRDGVIESIPLMKTCTKTDKLYGAIVGGDAKYIERIKGTYKTDDAYQGAVRKALRENDPRIHEAAQAGVDGNSEERNRIFREIKADLGTDYANLIIAAINSEVNAIKNKAEPDKVKSQYNTSEFVDAIIDNDTGTAQAVRDDIIDAHMANGKTQEDAEKAFATSVESSIKEALSYDRLDEAQAKKMLMEYADKDEEEAASKVGYWSFCDAHPEYEQYDLSESNVNKYLEFAEPAGIPMDVFVQYRDGTKGIETIRDEWGDIELSERDQVLEVIDSLDLTWQQKDALYLAHRYAESKIWDVPW